MSHFRDFVWTLHRLWLHALPMARSRTVRSHWSHRACSRGAGWTCGRRREPGCRSDHRGVHHPVDGLDSPGKCDVRALNRHRRLKRGASSPVEACAQGDGAIVTSDIAVTRARCFTSMLRPAVQLAGAAGAGCLRWRRRWRSDRDYARYRLPLSLQVAVAERAAFHHVGGASGNGGIAGRLPDGAGENGDSGWPRGGRFHGLKVSGLARKRKCEFG